MAVCQILSKGRAFAVSSRAASSALVSLHRLIDEQSSLGGTTAKTVPSRWQHHRLSPHRFLKIDFNCVIRSKNVRSSL